MLHQTYQEVGFLLWEPSSSRLRYLMQVRTSFPVPFLLLLFSLLLFLCLPCCILFGLVIGGSTSLEVAAVFLGSADVPRIRLLPPTPQHSTLSQPYEAIQLVVKKCVLESRFAGTAPTDANSTCRFKFYIPWLCGTNLFHAFVCRCQERFTFRLFRAHLTTLGVLQPKASRTPVWLMFL